METVTLVLVFLDTDSNEKSIVIKDPKEEMSLEEINTAMEAIINNDAILTAAGKHLASVSKCYYKTVTITYPEPEDGE